MRLVFLILLFGVTPVFACGPDVADHEKFTLTVKVDSAQSDIGWNNHLEFLYYFNVLSRETSIDIPVHRLKVGHCPDQATLEAKVKRAASYPVGNLMLRLYIGWAEKLAQDLKKPEKAGEIFLGLMNRRGLKTHEIDGTLRVGTDASVPNLIQKLSFSSHPGLSEMDKVIESQGAIDRELFHLFYLGLRLSAPLWRTRQSVDPATSVETNLLPPLRILKIPATPLRQVAKGSWIFSLDISGTQHQGSLLVRGHERNTGYFLLPAADDNLAELVQDKGALLSIDGEQVVAYVPLSTPFSERIYDEYLFIERLLFPYLMNSQAIQFAANAYTATTGYPAHHIVVPTKGPPPEASDFNKHPERLRERAIAHALAATLELSAGPPELNLQDMVMRIFARDPEGTATYATIEKIARAQKLPVHVMAQRFQSRGVAVRWPPFPRFEARPYQPTHAGVIWVRHDSFSPQILQQYGVSREENLRLLESHTGHGVKLDSSRN